MAHTFSEFFVQQLQRRLSVLATAANVTARPGSFANNLVDTNHQDLSAAVGYFFKCVAFVLFIETAFSFVFKTSFSDLVHHAYPIFIALLGVLTIYVFLKLLLTPGLTFAGAATATLYVGGTALLVMITLIFSLLTADFASNYDSVMSSGCEHRTIMCLLSGNMQYEYGVLEAGKNDEIQGWSFHYIVFLILFMVAYYTLVLGRVLLNAQGVARWRTYIASLLSLIVLAPACLILINMIYALIYK